MPPKPHINPCTPDTKIGFGPGQVTPPTNTSVPSSTSFVTPLNKHLPPIYQHKVTAAQIIANNTTEDTPLSEKCDLSRLLNLLHSLILYNYTLLSLKDYNHKLTLNITASVKLASEIILTDLKTFDPTTTLFTPLVPPVSSPRQPKTYWTYIMLSRVLDKDIVNSIKISA